MTITDTNALEIYRGDKATVSITITDSDGTAFDLTNYTLRLTVKANARDTNADAIIGPISGSITVAANGTATFPFTTNDTDVNSKEYVYDVEIVNGSATYTVVKSTLKIIEDVTK